MASKPSATAALCSACRASLSRFTIPLQLSKQPNYRLGRLQSFKDATRNSTTSNGNGVRRRAYATTSRPSNSSSSSSDPFKNALPPWPSSPEPTPYEILGMSPRDPYTKRRFHQLVKFYHPDMAPSTSSPSATLSQATRIERYRLVVAANDLLSNPSKRELYDRHATGWLHDGRAPNIRERDRTWRHQPDTAARNATWEDWEAWHQEQRRRQYGGEPPRPLYMSHGMFASIVVALCFVGALAQRSRAETVGSQYVEFAQDRNADIGRQMQRATYAAAGMSREERIDSFVRDRENMAYRYRPARFEEDDVGLPSGSMGQQPQQQKQHPPS